MVSKLYILGICQEERWRGREKVSCFELCMEVSNNGGQPSSSVEESVVMDMCVEGVIGRMGEHRASEKMCSGLVSTGVKEKKLRLRKIDTPHDWSGTGDCTEVRIGLLGRKSTFFHYGDNYSSHLFSIVQPSVSFLSSESEYDMIAYYLIIWNCSLNMFMFSTLAWASFSSVVFIHSFNV